MSPFLLRRLSDELLGSRLAAGEAAAFDELYRRYLHRLSAYSAHLLGDASSGDDVAQSTLLKAYGALRDGRVPERVRPWLYRIAHNTAIDLAVRRRELLVEALPERAAAGDESPGALVAALAALPDRQRRVYVLRELHGLRIDETAAELGLGPQQVEQALFAARNRLAEHLMFGDRLNCVAVRRLATGPLDGDERRALKSHLRSCADCRAAVGHRSRALGFVPGATLDWLRGLAATAVGSSAPVAAKVGAVVAGASLAAVPAAVEVTKPHATGEPRFRGLVSAVTPRVPVRSPVPLPHVAPAARAVAAARVVAVRPLKVAAKREDPPETERHDDGSSGPGPAAVAPAPAPKVELDTGSSDTGSSDTDGRSGSSSADGGD